jgi:hypothetical protein
MILEFVDKIFHLHLIFQVIRKELDGSLSTIPRCPWSPALEPIDSPIGLMQHHSAWVRAGPGEEGASSR